MLGSKIYQIEINSEQPEWKGYKYFMYCYDDIVLFQDFAPFWIDRYDKVPILGRNYIVGKCGLK